MSSKDAEFDVIRRLEKMIERIVDNLSLEQPISISLLKKRPSSSLPSSPPMTDPISAFSTSFPGKTPEEAWRFAVLLRILDLIHEALITKAVVSKRNIFYKDPFLFKTQSVVDRYIDVLAHTLGVSRKALNVSAASKGLVCGRLSITRPDGSIVQKGLDGKVFLVDDPSEVQAISTFQASWILMVEKESTFRTLSASQNSTVSGAGEGILLTAKGYPDLSTRSFVRLMTTVPNAPPLFALTDLDPDGLAIMSTYKYGSAALSHETPHLAASSLKWLGIRSRDVLVPAPFPCSDTAVISIDSVAAVAHNKVSDDEGLLRLSIRDRKKGISLLQNNDAFKENGMEPEWRAEIQWMLMCGYKVEMEHLDRGGLGNLRTWVEKRLLECVVK